MSMLSQRPVAAFFHVTLFEAATALPETATKAAEASTVVEAITVKRFIFIKSPAYKKAITVRPKLIDPTPTLAMTDESEGQRIDGRTMPKQANSANHDPQG
ncbi:hypothetical protein [Streptomyces celluloflavus]|uniref:hypothetical protein n=1 Tax=Streptomyces celluloflavus TaxID=58344 RepID=UPI003657EB21